MIASRTTADQADTLRQLAVSAKKRSLVGDPSTLKLRDGLRVISVTSGKGGVGKSSVVVNLAVSLAEQGRRVLVLDADSAMGNVSLLFGERPLFSLYDVLLGEALLEEALVEVGTGIAVVTFGMGQQQYATLPAPQVHAMLRGMEQLGEQYDFFLIDNGCGISAPLNSFTVHPREILLVVTPEPTSLMDAYAQVKTLSARCGAIPFKLLVNMCRDEEEGRALFQKLSAITGRFLEVSMEYMGCIVRDDKVAESARRRGALGRLFPDARATQGFDALAQKLTADDAAGAGIVRQKEWRNHELSS